MMALYRGHFSSSGSLLSLTMSPDTCITLHSLDTCLSTRTTPPTSPVIFWQHPRHTRGICPPLSPPLTRSHPWGQVLGLSIPASSSYLPSATSSMSGDSPEIGSVMGIPGFYTFHPATNVKNNKNVENNN